MLISLAFSQFFPPQQVLQVKIPLRDFKQVPFLLEIAYFAPLYALCVHTSWSQKITFLQHFLGHACLQHYTWVSPRGSSPVTLAIAEVHQLVTREQKCPAWRHDEICNYLTSQSVIKNTARFVFVVWERMHVHVSESKTPWLIICGYKRMHRVGLGSIFT